MDGASLMSDVCDAILAAKHEVFITDWWLSPEIYMKRGLDFNPALRLDLLLQMKAVSYLLFFLLSFMDT